VVNFTPRPGKEPPVPIGEEVGWTSEPVWTIWRRENKIKKEVHLLILEEVSYCISVVIKIFGLNNFNSKANKHLFKKIICDVLVLVNSYNRRN
jgi:hypothetical protein